MYIKTKKKNRKKETKRKRKTEKPLNHIENLTLKYQRLLLPTMHHLNTKELISITFLKRKSPITSLVLGLIPECIESKAL